MAGENAAELRARIDALYVCFAQRDPEAVARLCSAGVRLYTLRSALEGPYVGRDGARRFIADTERDWTDMQVHVDEVELAGSSLALVLGRLAASGPGSGAAVGGSVGFVWTFDDAGLATEMRVYTDPGLARDAFEALVRRHGGQDPGEDSTARASPAR